MAQMLQLCIMHLICSLLVIYDMCFRSFLSQGFISNCKEIVDMFG